MAGKHGAADAKRPTPLARRAGLSAGRLAAALGLTPLMAPAGSLGSPHRKGTSSHAALIASARKQIGGRWHTSSSPQHVRAILQVRRRRSPARAVFCTVTLAHV